MDRAVRLFLVGARCGEKPGEGALAKKGYANAQPIIGALDRYRQEHEDYPQRLIELLPKYLDQLPLDENNQNYSYRRLDEKKSYELKFNYDAPGLGICECEYYPDLKKWYCSCLI